MWWFCHTNRRREGWLGNKNYYFNPVLKVPPHYITLESAKKIKGPRGYHRWECNLAAVWGQLATGDGHAQLEETMSTLGVPVMTKSSFTQSEHSIGEWWRQQLQQSMAAAGEDEKRLAEERGDYHECIPAITVIIDGGWSKRSPTSTAIPLNVVLPSSWGKRLVFASFSV